MESQAHLNRFTYQASAAAWPFFVISTITFGMRSVSRLWYTEFPIGWDDITISISWVLNVVRMVTFQLALNATRRVDVNNLSRTVPTATFWALFTDSWAFLSVTLPKVAVAFLLIRIFRPRPWVRTTILSMALGLFVVCIAGFIICFVQCNPVAGQWDPYKYPNAHCWPRNVQIDYALVGSSTSAFLDLAFAMYPAFVIWKLQLPMWKKLSTMVLMGLGLASFALGVVKVANNGSLLGTPTLNQLYTDALHIGLWNSLENDFVMIAACLPLVPPLFVARKQSQSTALNTFHSLKSHTRQENAKEYAIEIAKNAQPLGWSDQGIHVKSDYSFQLEPVVSTGRSY